ncbi:uncharacterized protein LOC108427650 isoform X2 [Pygocentrus nattereri]|uniref:uncharacterized protein LOC108427650 isoform X2 n=1 Tax=Pygocentrus nattereri TaxID=42514 RepID=UPI0008145A50|nr:uncharacterized protein LOC108427650 isoform X2 [Pygocentrus nattereri]
MMDSGYEILSNSGYADTCKVTMTEMPECFICRDVQLVDGEPLRRFCDCKNLMAHHSCLLTWVRKGLGSEDRLRCSACNAEYQQCRTAVWKTLACQWQTWPVVVVAVALLALVPYAVVRMLTAFQNPPPHALFRTAAICFGLLTETLLIRCLFCYVSGRYRQAEQSSFSLQPRGLEEEPEDLAVNSHGQQPEAGEGGQERGANGGQRNPLWPWKSRPAVRKEKQIDLQ